MSNIKTFNDLIKELNKLDKKQKGTKFEEICKQVLEKSPFFTDEVKKVWLWNEFPYRNNEHDTGIDIIVQDINNDYWSIQCKCYDEHHTISKSEIDKFIARSSKGFKILNEDGSIKSKENFVRKYIFATSNIDISRNLDGYEIIYFNYKDFQNSNIDWSLCDPNNDINLKVIYQKKVLKDYQKEAVNAVINGFKENDRGQLIMACGSGKTFTSLKIVEQFIKLNCIEQANILYLVPSIPLLSQTITEWKIQLDHNEVKNKVSSYAICSDPTSTIKAKSYKNYDDEEDELSFPIPATTSAKKLKEMVEKNKNNKRHNFFFCTYQSIEVVMDFQKELGFKFDLVICDEAHRTFGVKVDGDDKTDSSFKKVHDNKNINSEKRLYMTATPKIYASKAINTIKKHYNGNQYDIYSMDKTDWFGPTFYKLTFGQAISKGILTDYRIIGLTVNKNKLLKSSIMKTTNIDSASKIWALLSGLSKNNKSTIITSKENPFLLDPNPSLKSVVFTKFIKQAKKISEIINNCRSESWFGEKNLIKNKYIIPYSDHIEGKNSSFEKNKKLDWLKSDKDVIVDKNYKISKILTNAKCLTEGVDVPALDAIAFFERKTSQVDIIQACGRVMRKSQKLIDDQEYEEKKYGYIIVPIIVEKDTLDDDEINNNEDYKLLLKVVRALRSHDERLDNDLERMTENGRVPANICLINSYIPPEDYLDDSNSDSKLINEYNISSEQFKKQEGVFDSYIYKYVGNRDYWEILFKDMGDVANLICKRIKHEIEKSKDIKEEFSHFITGLREVINPWVSEESAIDILSQHIVVLPFLQSIFENDNLLNKNLVFKLLQKMFSKLFFLKEETDKLYLSYRSIQNRINEIKNNTNDASKAKQELIKNLFEKYFVYTDSKSSDKNGIIYTPIEIVDFIINSVVFVLKNKFNKNIFDKDVKILDPFTGTGSFITRLLNKLYLMNLSKEDIEYKYRNDIWCNEIMLLSYYIALINIEYTYNVLTNDQLEFTHCLWTDTFQIEENIKNSSQARLEIEDFKDISSLAKEEHYQKIKIIIGNPPYFSRQKSSKEHNKKNDYPLIDKNIKLKYSSRQGLNEQPLHDSYIRAFRWATDLIVDDGIIAFISNGDFIESPTFLGIRESLVKEFNSIYIYDLLGNVNQFGNKIQGENVFGSGSKSRICITFLIKNGKEKDGFINYFKIGDNLKTKEKLEEIKKYQSIENINFTKIIPSDKHEWLLIGNKNYDKHLLLFFHKMYKGKNEEIIFGDNRSSAIKTNNNIWRINFSLVEVKKLDDLYINIYNEAREKWLEVVSYENNLTFSEFLSKYNYLKKIKWTDILEDNCKANVIFIQDENDKLNLSKAKDKFALISKNYKQIFVKPFVKKWINMDKNIVYAIYSNNEIYPKNDELKNKSINILYNGRYTFAALASNQLYNLSAFEIANVYSVPLYWYSNESENLSKQLMSSSKYSNNFAISDDIVKKFKEKYLDESITHEDIFNYIYGLFHSKKYIELYLNNLVKDVPRIPFLENFRNFANIGKELIDLHVNYESLEPYKNVNVIVTNSKLDNDYNKLSKDDFRLVKMKIDMENLCIKFNDNIEIRNIPKEAFEYKIVNKSPLEWIKNGYKIEINNDYEYEIINDPNEYDPEKGGKYVFDLILSLITLSLKTNELIKQLPEYKEI